MAYSAEIYKQAQAVLEQRRSAAQAHAAAMRQRLLREIPRLREIEQQMAQSSGKVVSAILNGNNVEQEVERIKAENLSLQVEMSMLLREHDAGISNFEPQYTCPRCEDTGFRGSRRCECFQTLLRELSCQALSELSGMRPLKFEDMSLDYYSSQADARTGISPRARMREVIAYCRAYAEGFDGSDVSLLLRGPTGVGKTHLSLAIAGEVLSRGYSVVYGPVQKLLHRIENEHFGRSSGNSEDVMTGCDLLILDDVGTEFSSSFYTSALYNIINERMLSGKPTVISTNLNQKELTDRYGEQIASRVTGTFQPLVCVGSDIRQLKLRQSLT